MAESAIRFGVKNQEGLRAATWKCWTRRGVGKLDVYLSCRELGGELKVSFHESGQWHTAFKHSTWLEGFDSLAARPESRFSDQWSNPVEVSPGCFMAFQIFVPGQSPNVGEGADDPSVLWVSEAVPGEAVEFSIVFTPPVYSPEKWPGKDSAGTELLGQFELDNAAKVWIVHRKCPFTMPPMGTGRSSLMHGATHADLQAANLRAIIFGNRNDGVRFMIDARIQYMPDESA